LRIERIEYDRRIHGELMPVQDIDPKNPLDNLIKYSRPEISGNDILYVNKEYEPEVLRITEKQNRPKSILIYGLGNVGGTLLTGLRMLLDADRVSHIAVYDRKKELAERYEMEINQLHPPFQKKQVPVVILDDISKIPAFDIIIFSAAAQIPPLTEKQANVRDIQFPGNSRILETLIYTLGRGSYHGSIIIVSDPVDILCTYLQMKLKLLSCQITGIRLGVMAARANYILEKRGFFDFYKKGQIFGPHNEGVIAVPCVESSSAEDALSLSRCIETLNHQVRQKGYFPYIAPAISSVAYNLSRALEGHEALACIYIDSIYWGFRVRYENGLWYPVLQYTNERFRELIRERFDQFRERTFRVLGLKNS